MAISILILCGLIDQISISVFGTTTKAIQKEISYVAESGRSEPGDRPNRLFLKDLLLDFAHATDQVEFWESMNSPHKIPKVAETIRPVTVLKLKMARWELLHFHDLLKKHPELIDEAKSYRNAKESLKQ